jgi:glucoamylase
MKLLRRQLCQILLYARLLPLSCAKQQTVYHAHHAAQLPFFSTAAPQSLALTDWLSAQKNVSWQGILKNIYGVDSAYPGVVVAAPPGKTGEREDAGTYWYNWTRDAALVMKGLVRRFAKGDKSLEPLIRAYISNAEALQRVPNRSGDITTGGLGEPKVRDGKLTLD